METSLLIGGFGGQGVVLIGQLLGYSAAAAGKDATFYPSYGPEQRGGTANATVVISDEPIASPIVNEVDTVIALNEPSLVRFEPRVKENGTIIVNSSLIKRRIGRNDVRVIEVPANDIAHDLGADKASNMVMLGAFLGASHSLGRDDVVAMMRQKMAAKVQFLDINEAAILAGFEAGEKARPPAVAA